MKKLLLAALVILTVTGCSSKTITYDPMGTKTVSTVLSEDKYHEEQAKAWKNYYTAIENPPVIAVITAPDGTVTKIHSQMPPPAPVIRQHQNQIIKPVAEIAKWVVGGVVLDRGIRAVVKGAGDVITENTGDGTVYVDRSDSIASKSDAAFETQTDSSDRSDNSDNSIIDRHDQTADPVIVEQPEYNDPVILRPEIVDPIIVNQGE